MWVSPTGHVDPSNKWTNEEGAYDEATSTNAYHTKKLNFLELTHSAIQCDKVRIYAATAKAVWYDPDVDIDVYYSGGWHNIWSGIVSKLTWVEKEIGSAQLVTAMRIKWNTIPGGGYGALFEADFNEVSGLTSGYWMVEVEKFGYFINSIEEFGYYIN